MNGKRFPKKLHKTKHDEINIKAHGTEYFIYCTSFIVLLQTCIENTLLLFISLFVADAVNSCSLSDDLFSCAFKQDTAMSNFKWKITAVSMGPVSQNYLMTKICHKTNVCLNYL